MKRVGIIALIVAGIVVSAGAVEVSYDDIAGYWVQNSNWHPYHKAFFNADQDFSKPIMVSYSDYSGVVEHVYGLYSINGKSILVVGADDEFTVYQITAFEAGVSMTLYDMDSGDTSEYLKN